MEDRKDPKELIERYLDGSATAMERAIVESWYENYSQTIISENSRAEMLADLEIVQKRLQEETTPAKVQTLWLRRLTAAAAITIAASTAAYFLWPKSAANTSNSEQLAEQIKPMNKGIVLTLGNGQKFILNNQHQGVIKTTDGSAVDQQDSTLSYTGNTQNQQTHTLTNNTGNKYELTLADGTQVWLDAASSITYPVAFTKKDRQVSIEGQAYFKVKHDAAHPFSVKVKNQVIDDIGTEFNINNYEATATTLISGVVKVNSNHKNITLKPGQTASSDELEVSPANIEIVTAWLQDKMVLKRTPLEAIMNEIARTYDIKINWQDPALKQLRFGGGFSRKLSLADVLNYLRKSGDIDFKVEGKTVTVLKK